MIWKIALRFAGLLLIGFGLTGIVIEIGKARKAVTAESAEKPVLTYGVQIPPLNQEIHNTMTSLANTSLYTGITWGWKMHDHGWTLEETLLEYTNHWNRTNQ